MEEGEEGWFAHTLPRRGSAHLRTQTHTAYETFSDRAQRVGRRKAQDLWRPFPRGRGKSLRIQVGNPVGWFVALFRHRHVDEHLQPTRRTFQQLHTPRRRTDPTYLTSLANESLLLQEVLNVSVLTIEDQVSLAILWTAFYHGFKSVVAGANVNWSFAVGRNALPTATSDSGTLDNTAATLLDCCIAENTPQRFALAESQ